MDNTTGDSLHAAADLGIEILVELDGSAKCQLIVESRHLNRQGACHGGIIFTLADTAMALASNGGSRVAVASHASINYLLGSESGDILIASARFVGGSGKSRLFDVQVEKHGGPVVAEFRGTTITIG
jgi:acyl-CoA thioesterase